MSIISIKSFVEENRIIKKQNAILKKLQEVFGQVGILLKQWKERLNDIRRKQRSYSPDGEYDKPDRGSTGIYGRDVPGDGAEGWTTHFVSGAESKIAGIKQRVARAASNLAKYRGTVGTIGEEGWRSSDIKRGQSDAERRKSAMERINGEVERREPVIAETERGIAELQNRLEKAGDVDERFKKLKARRADGGNAVISIGVVVTSVALVVYFGDWIKDFVKLNLVVLLLLVQAVYAGIRVYVNGCKRARGYY